MTMTRLFGRRLLAAGLLFLLCYWSASRRIPTGVVTGEGLRGGTPLAWQQPETIRVATWNIHSGRGQDGRTDLERVARRLIDYHLVGLNEIRGDWAWRGARDQAAELASYLDCSSLFLPFERRWFRDDFGNAILSNCLVMEWKREPLPHARTKGHGNLTRAAVDVVGGPVLVMVTHIDHREDRRQQLEFVIGQFLAVSGPVVLMGDFNTRPDDPLIAGLLQHGDVIDVLADREPPTPADRIDWILARGMECLDAGLELGIESDHPLVWAELRVVGVSPENPNESSRAPVHSQRDPEPGHVR
jgi:endonuclease/exonuclease/phosphatase family metal-dependent hydrolase